MKRAIIAVLLTVAAAPVWAEWVRTGTNETTGATGYADPATTRRAGNMAKMWHLIDFKTAQQSKNNQKEYLSAKAQREYDCKGERWRILYFSLHSENLGKGEVVYSDSEPSRWEPIPPDSALETEWKMACGKK